mmetsp:Transcript_8103/g.16819  ORF Transcript_8103/g.16819 Transcript_8103/m.16819 type:complete len:81 (-) Transcript_8103:76-318(-)
MMKTLALSFGLFVAGAEAKAIAKPKYDYAAHKSKYAILAAGDSPIWIFFIFLQSLNGCKNFHNRCQGVNAKSNISNLLSY